MELSLKTNSILSIVFRFLLEDRYYLLYIRKRSSENDNIDYCSKQRNTVECGRRICDKIRSRSSIEQREKRGKNQEEKDERLRRFLQDIRKESIKEIEALYTNQVFFHHLFLRLPKRRCLSWSAHEDLGGQVHVHW